MSERFTCPRGHSCHPSRLSVAEGMFCCMECWDPGKYRGRLWPAREVAVLCDGCDFPMPIDGACRGHSSEPLCDQCIGPYLADHQTEGEPTVNALYGDQSGSEAVGLPAHRERIGVEAQAEPRETMPTWDPDDARQDGFKEGYDIGYSRGAARPRPVGEAASGSSGESDGEQ